MCRIDKQYSSSEINLKNNYYLSIYFKARAPCVSSKISVWCDDDDDDDDDDDIDDSNNNTKNNNIK